MKKFARIPTTSQLRSLEASFIESCHNNWGLVLMELAGKRAAERARAMWERACGPVMIFCGRGNNGGDGLVVARYLRLWNVPVSVYMVAGNQKKATETRNESIINKEAAEKLGLKINIVGEKDLADIAKAAHQTGIIVDGLLGTGLDRPLEGIYSDLVKIINDSKRPVLSIDVPSGINSDNGQIMGSAVKATQTVTFGYLKSGLLLFPGADLAGDINLVDIGLPELPADTASHWLTTKQHVLSLLPKRPENSHKGSFGTTLTIAGSMNYRGAATLASLTALRVGAGLSILATAKSVIPEQSALEIIYKGLDETKSGSIATTAVEQVKDALSKASAVIVGPGLGLEDDTVAFVQKLLPLVDKPCIIDADGLNSISKNTSTFPRNRQFVLTPHPKEFSRLTGIETADAQANRIDSAVKAAQQFDAVIVLKGAHTIIANALGQVFINPTGNAGMATAGSGDVLSGIIGGLLSQGLSCMDAAVAGTYIHGLAGDIAASEIGETGYLAGEISQRVPHALHLLHDAEFAGSVLENQLFAGLDG